VRTVESAPTVKRAERFRVALPDGRGRGARLFDALAKEVTPVSEKSLPTDEL
jgi:hypothetical protein